MSKCVNFLKSNNPDFVNCCRTVPLPWGKKNKEGILIGIPTTRRQASKWLRKKGIAYKTFKGLV